MTMTGKWISQRGRWLSKWWREGSSALPLWACGSRLVTHFTLCWTLAPHPGFSSHHASWESFHLRRSVFLPPTHLGHVVYRPDFELWLVFWFPLPSRLLCGTPALAAPRHLTIYWACTRPSWSMFCLCGCHCSFLISKVPWGSYSSYSPHLYLYRDISKCLCLHDSLFFENVRWGRGSCSSVALVGGDPFLRAGELWPYPDSLSIAPSMELD